MLCYVERSADWVEGCTSLPKVGGAAETCNKENIFQYTQSSSIISYKPEFLTVEYRTETHRSAKRQSSALDAHFLEVNEEELGAAMLSQTSEASPEAAPKVYGCGSTKALWAVGTSGGTFTD